MADVDFGRHSNDYARHRPGFPRSFYRRLGSMLCLEGSRALDLATGPGVIALELGKRSARTTGIDISEDQIATARRVARERGLEQSVDFVVARAENTGLQADGFDLVTAGQCWHWFDRPKAMAEARRVLRPEGLLIIAYYSYLAEHCAVARDTEKLILEFNPSWTMAGSTGMYPEEIDKLIRGGFNLVEQFCYHEEERFTHEAWRGRMRTCNGVGSGGLRPDAVAAFDDALATMLREAYPDPIFVEHRVWSLVVRTVPGRTVPRSTGSRGGP